MDSLLIREKLQGALGSETYNKSEEALALIRLQLEDGPLTQIMHIKTALEAWNRLKELYNPHSAYSGVGSIGLTRTSLPPNHRSSKYVRVLQVGTLKYLEKIISISFSHLLNTNTSPASNSSLIASFRLSRHLEQIRPIDSLQRSSQRSARYTYSGHSTRLISAQGSRHIDRRAVPIAVIALDQSQIVRLIHNVKVFLQITYLPSVTYSHVIVL
ncbi:hypothetical protein L249_7078 [Ophiocordyceps polyrhachis-furcata BCC 54312]|uniref:Uncharacterized protein n=1 Tax=Ophiocordyceps polyrhachis-furcata BCC 54312 TaxID=1330021 RepID=A0A367LJE2_9HYPO|nr:hypothetical protein L249_7078 [Ophiocordyceps polyrhachis-furcata BCC 54312]